MSERGDAFLEKLKERTNYRAPTEEQVRVADATHVYYMNMKGGKIVRHVATTVRLYAQTALPELSQEQVMDLASMTHTLIETVLSYLVEDCLIKEE